MLDHHDDDHPEQKAGDDESMIMIINNSGILPRVLTWAGNVIGIYHAHDDNKTREKDDRIEEIAMLALRMDPNDIAVLNNYARILEGNGSRWQEAVDVNRRVVAINPSNPDNWIQLGSAVQAVGGGFGEKGDGGGIGGGSQQVEATVSRLDALKLYHRALQVQEEKEENNVKHGKSKSDGTRARIWGMISGVHHAEWDLIQAIPAYVHRINARALKAAADADSDGSPTTADLFLTIGMLLKMVRYGRPPCIIPPSSATVSVASVASSVDTTFIYSEDIQELAIDVYMHALQLAKEDADAATTINTNTVLGNIHGRIYQLLGSPWLNRYHDSLYHADQAVMIDPYNWAALNTRDTYHDLGRHDLALAAAQRFYDACVKAESDGIGCNQFSFSQKMLGRSEI